MMSGTCICKFSIVLTLSKLSLNRTWQSKINFISYIGWESCSIATIKNSIKAVKHLVFDKVESMLKIAPLPSVYVEETDSDIALPGYQVSLEPVICWQVRDLHLQGHSDDKIQLNLKLDGRPFAGNTNLST